jgi:tetratricopeptide (TPR) repeat protein
MKSLHPLKSLGYLALLILAAGCATAPIQEAPTVPTPSQSTDDLIAFHEMRVQNDPQGAIGWSMLAESYVARSREKDDDESALKAEEAARRSLAIRKSNNSRPALALTQALLEQHRFEDSLNAAELALTLEPGNQSAARTRAEIFLELGRYEEFQKTIQTLTLDDPNGQLILARWHEIKGDNAKAKRLLTIAAQKSEVAAHTDPQTTAWFYTKLGEAQFRFGNPEEARKSLTKALDLDPNSYKAAAAMTRLEAGLGNWQAVIEWGEKTAPTAKMTDIQALVADAHLSLGQKTTAEQIYKEIETANATPEMLAMKPTARHSHPKSTKRHTHDRLFALFLADRSRHPFLAHHAAEEDLATRKDIHAWDTFAWATFQYYANVPAEETGEGDFLLKEAQHSIDKALATGVKDARILFHAGMIYRQTHPAKAATFLHQALAINPYFNARQVEATTKLLKKLKG